MTQYNYTYSCSIANELIKPPIYFPFSTSLIVRVDLNSNLAEETGNVSGCSHGIFCSQRSLQLWNCMQFFSLSQWRSPALTFQHAILTATNCVHSYSLWIYSFSSSSCTTGSYSYILIIIGINIFRISLLRIFLWNHPWIWESNVAIGFYFRTRWYLTAN